MLGDVIVALIAVAGAALPAVVSSGRAARERKAIREEIELLDALPEDLRGDLREHVQRRLNTYLRGAAVAPERRHFSTALVLWIAGGLLALWGFDWWAGFELVPQFGVDQPTSRTLGVVLFAIGYAVMFRGSMSARGWLSERRRRLVNA